MKILLPLLSLVICLIMGEVSAFTHIVGAGHGWKVPDNLTYFEEWAKPRTFGVGDRLVFPSRPMGNNVVSVSKEDFNACTQDKIFEMFFEGPLIMNLTQPGDYYFYNGVGRHCEAGQKLHITVGLKEGSSGDLSPFNLFEAQNTGSASANASPPDAAKRSDGSRSAGSASFEVLSVLLFVTYLM